MRQHYDVITLFSASRAAFPGEIPALADAENLAKSMHGELLLRLIDEIEPHRLPSLAKKVAARFKISRSWRRISFSRRSRFNSEATSSTPAGMAGASIIRSRLRPIQRTSVDSPIPRSSAISRCVRPLVRTSRTASSSNSRVNRFCFVIEFTFHLRKTLHFLEASPTSTLTISEAGVKAIPIEPAEVPATWWRAHPPKLDQEGLNGAISARKSHSLPSTKLLILTNAIASRRGST